MQKLMIFEEVLSKRRLLDFRKQRLSVISESVKEKKQIKKL